MTDDDTSSPPPLPAVSQPTPRVEDLRDRPYPCPGCGASLNFAARAQSLECPYCGYKKELPNDASAVQELDFDSWLNEDRAPHAKLASKQVRCTGCAAVTVTNDIARTCAFCGAPLAIESEPEDGITPNAVLPFKVDRNAALQSFRAWIASRWFAPSTLKNLAAHEGIRGVYAPHWTFDTFTRTFYTGERGDHYYVTQMVQSVVNGKTVTRPQQVRKTRWRSAAGRVERWFDDVMVPAVTRVSAEELTKLAPWDLKMAVPFSQDYLAGFEAMRHDVTLKSAFPIAQEIMRSVIRGDCCRDIGGDEQRVHDMKTDWSAITFKQVLLPIWLAAYRFDSKVFRVYVNARTGEVIGERPWSVAKIVLLVLLIAAVIATIVFLSSRN